MKSRGMKWAGRILGEWNMDTPRVDKLSDKLNDMKLFTYNTYEILRVNFRYHVWKQLECCVIVLHNACFSYVL
jgi:hypothetical protein